MGITCEYSRWGNDQHSSCERHETSRVDGRKWINEGDYPD